MQKYRILYLACLSLLLTQCQQEIIPPEYTSQQEKLQRHHLRRSSTRPRPITPPPRYFDLVAWLDQYAGRHAQLDCSPFLGFVQRQGRGFLYSCNTHHAVLKGKVRIRRISYYRLDLYYFVRPTSPCGNTSQSPSYAGSIYISRSPRKPQYAPGYYQGTAPISWLVDAETTHLNGWYVHYYYSHQRRNDPLTFFDGLTANYGGCVAL
ncbi:MAG: hypothetical protein AAF992_20700 [Bacteroidota bacterium]